ncbi:MAG: hypothetical protein ACT4OJ_15925 [Bacteroidota bacterium]
MKFLSVFSLTLLLISCSRGGTVSKRLAGSDSLVITFNAPNSDSDINMISTTETQAVRKLARFLDGKPAAQDKCGFDGNMIFFKNGQQVLPVVFKYSEPDCRHFLFDIENKLTSSSMSNEAASFLQSLAEGRDWY